MSWTKIRAFYKAGILKRNIPLLKNKNEHKSLFPGTKGISEKAQMSPSKKKKLEA